MRSLVGAFLIASLWLGGCASIPLSTALSLSSLSPQSLAQTDPAQVRVKLSVPVGYELDISAVLLKLSLSGQSQSRSSAMSLTLLDTNRELRSGGWFSPDVPVLTYVLALSPEGVQTLRELQGFVISDQPNHFKLSVNTPFTKMPEDPKVVTFWADLKLSLDDPFMPLIDGAEMRFERSPASS